MEKKPNVWEVHDDYVISVLLSFYHNNNNIVFIIYLFTLFP